MLHFAEEQDGATHLELEDLSSWRLGRDPDVAPRHPSRPAHPVGRIGRRTRGPGCPVPTCPTSSVPCTTRPGRPPDRPELTDAVRDLGDSLVGRVAEVERQAEASGPTTFTHGDASALNMRTSPDGEVALLDWEDYGAGPGIVDLAWHLVSSVAPRTGTVRWRRTATRRPRGRPAGCRGAGTAVVRVQGGGRRPARMDREPRGSRPQDLTGSLPTRTPDFGTPAGSPVPFLRVLGGCPMRPPARQGGRPWAA